MTTAAILSLLVAGLSNAAALPLGAMECLARHPEATLNELQRPAFLRVQFSASGVSNYVIAVKEHSSRLNRALVCKWNGQDILLESKSAKHPFSDAKNDDYMSSKWRACSKKRVIKLRSYYHDVPETANGAICLLWEDGEALIYSDGTNLLWKTLEP